MLKLKRDEDTLYLHFHNLRAIVVFPTAWVPRMSKDIEFLLFAGEEVEIDQ